MPSDMSTSEGKPAEAKDARFKRLAEKRVNVILDRLRLLGQLSDKRNYDYDDEQIAKIFKAVEGEVKAVKAKFRNGSSERKRFTL